MCSIFGNFNAYISKGSSDNEVAPSDDDNRFVSKLYEKNTLYYTNEGQRLATIQPLFESYISKPIQSIMISKVGKFAYL